MTHRDRPLPAEGVRAMFDRIAPVYDLMNRVMTVGLDRRWRRLTAEAVVRAGDRVLDALLRHRRSGARRAEAGASEVIGLDFSERMLERARRKAPELEWVRGDLLAAPVRRRRRSTRRPSASASATSPTSRPGCASCGACCGRAGGSAILEITRPRGPLAPFYRLWFDGSCRCSARCFRVARPTRTCLRAFAASRRRRSSPRCSSEAGFGDVRFRLARRRDRRAPHGGRRE